MNADVYSSLLKALTMPDNESAFCYPVRISAAGAIAELLNRDQCRKMKRFFDIVSASLFCGWRLEEWISVVTTNGKSLSALLEQAWLTPMHPVMNYWDTPSGGNGVRMVRCTHSNMRLDDSSTLLRSVMLSVTEAMHQQLKLSELLLVWADLIADRHAWEELEDLSSLTASRKLLGLSQERDSVSKGFTLGVSAAAFVGTGSLNLVFQQSPRQLTGQQVATFLRRAFL
ncbi:hypothetical protein OIU76_011943 [Salix suchowensis]|nr:hypothetical protein OIU76_011943 [Salix suchowensis]